MGKHLKKLRAEKAKIQLKKKKLPKGQNVTDTSFKVKKIQLIDQLPQRADGEIVTTRNQTLKDLLNHLQHHNVNTQLGGLQGIKELFFNNPELFNGLNLRQVVTRVLELIVEDREHKVRLTAIKLLSSILPSLPFEVREPFSDLLNKQLQRALSHIHGGIQRDALRLLDLNLALYGSNKRTSLKHLLSLLFRLLVLTGNSAPSRIAVVRRLLALSEVVFGKLSAVEHKAKEVTVFDELGPLTSVYKTMARIPLGPTTIGHELVEEVQELVDKLTNVLIGVWTECSPDSVVADSSIELLHLIAKIVLLICRYLDDLVNDPDSSKLKNWYCNRFRKGLTRSFLMNFPYQVLGETALGSHQADYKEKEGSSPALFALNMDLARIYYWFKVFKPEIEKKMVIFINDSLQIRPVTQETISLLQILMKLKSKQESTLLMVTKSYMKSSDPLLLNFLCGFVLDPSKDYQCHPLIWQWVISLSRNLDKASASRVEVLSSLVSRGTDKTLEEAVRLEMPKILFQHPPAPFNDVFKRKLNILFWCCTEEELKESAKDERCSEGARNYIRDVLYS